jgi:hypothetical protein
MDGRAPSLGAAFALPREGFATLLDETQEELAPGLDVGPALGGLIERVS